jgi:NAD(P)-dependent dehydrogenase (short-subunit alcohol dehydrogenase family)
VRGLGSDGFIVQGDVCRPDDIGRMFSRAKQEFGTLDIFVANARPDVPTFYHPPMEITLESWQTAVDSQARAFLVGAREASALFRGGGRISYNLCAWRTLWELAAMGAAKSAMECLCRYFAVALARRKITVNAISPDWIEDSVLNTLPEAARNLIRNWHQGGWTPMGRLGTPADIGNAVALLCSEEAGWITGQLIAVDGGAGLMDAALPLEIQQVVPQSAATK